MAKHTRGRNRGEGDPVAAQHYNRELREFIEAGKVADAARSAKNYVERNPERAAGDERAAKRGPPSTRASVDELVAKGRTVIDRVRPIVAGVVSRVRARIGRK